MTANEVATEVIGRFEGFHFDRHDLADVIAAALEAYHLDRCRQALGEPPVSDERLAEIETDVGKLKLLLRDPSDLAFVAYLVRHALDAARHYRDLAMAAVTDHGASEMYERGRRAGIAEGARRCEKVMLEVPGFVQAADEYSWALRAVQKVGTDP